MFAETVAYLQVITVALKFKYVNHITIFCLKLLIGSVHIVILCSTLKCRKHIASMYICIYLRNCDIRSIFELAKALEKNV